MLHQFPEFWSSNECAGVDQARKALLVARLKGMGGACVPRAGQKPESASVADCAKTRIYGHPLPDKHENIFVEPTGAISRL